MNTDPITQVKATSCAIADQPHRDKRQLVRKQEDADKETFDREASDELKEITSIGSETFPACQRKKELARDVSQHALSRPVLFHRRPEAAGTH